MQYRRMGQTGLKLSALSFGTWATFGVSVPRGTARDLIAASYDHGINFFDAAETYANGEAERMLGDVLIDLRLPRDALVISSKVFFGAVTDPRPTQHGLSRKHIRDACDQALQRLKLDYIDLYFCHRPDLDVPISEIVTSMNLLIQQGKILYWGTSEWPATLIREAAEFALAHGLEGPKVEQPQYSLLAREKVEQEFSELYPQYGIGTTVWSPLASGLLTGKYNDGIPADSRLAHEQYQWLQKPVLQNKAKRIAAVKGLSDEAAKLGATAAQLALAWCLGNPNVSTVILGATRIGQLEENLKALALLEKVDAGTRARIEALFA
ncbi:aldo/keto reductase [Ahniella affigens]|uniref:Aldo/keto reductase n=1 Tax=Ahniella affigens TaxID=2021234 RepID=A0A2P1PXN4_9GAMM|nr:aldo/keto reductase [Ahniella affigens]AVP99611.1 aldo/keto reductase [Ahniella affigens]